uniref:Lipocalin/cytosolic fatty-acid binding domain-containing protein n=1 Tax=Graphocephala atropunctata TaxID=36148 RepID=A0A1B6LGE2_9HEMI
MQLSCNMRSSLLLLTGLASVFLHCGEAAKCDPNIEAAIYELAHGNVPKDILKTERCIGKSATVASTVYFYPNDTRCIYSFYVDSTIFVGIVNNYGSTVVHKLEFVEHNGYLYSIEVKNKVYYVYRKHGISALYICETEGSEGPPVGLVKARARGHNDKYIEEAIYSLQCIGVNTTVHYPHNCC